MSEKATALSIEEFNALLDLFAPFEDNPRIAVAVSGGSDSLALTLLLKDWVRQRQGSLMALTIDHQLRPESAQEAQQVRDWLTHSHIPHVILQWQHSKPATGVQEAARLARYQLLEEWCKDNGYLHLFLAHQQEDQYETMIIRTLQQSGLVGLAGMSKIVEKPFLRILRPLLNIPKARLSQYLKDKNQKWIEDPSNANAQFLRTKIRQRVPQADGEIISYQPYLQTYRACIERWLNHFLADNTLIYPFGYVELRATPFLRLPVEFQKPILLQILKTIGIGKYPPRMQALEPILTQMNHPHFKAVTCHGVRVSMREGRFLFVREYRRVKEVIHVRESQHIHTLYFDQRFEINARALIQKEENTLLIKKVGEEGWAQLVRHYPSLKEISFHKPALWSLPAAWRGQEILLKYNMIYEWLIKPKEKYQQKNFVFKPQYHFSCFIFSRSS